MTPRVRRFENLEELSRAAAAAFARVAAEHAPATIGLSGGSTPQRLFELLAGEWRDAVPWPSVHLFWVDERFVPADDPDSNYGDARERLIRRVPIPPANVHPVPTYAETIDRAAELYEDELRSLLGERPTLLDLAVLGVGDDGHTASLFPGLTIPAARLAAAVRGPASRPPRERVTMTLDALNRSRHVLFLVSGDEKRDALARAVRGDADAPAGLVHGIESTTFLVDHAAAKGLAESGA